jgi:two-component sensor histidine kinase
VAIHELATNAAKYGALSAPGGHVELTWQTDGSDRIRIVWRESGGPPVQPPQRQGFGTTAIDRMVRQQLGGEVRFDWHPQGLVCEMILPRV